MGVAINRFVEQRIITDFKEAKQAYDKIEKEKANGGEQTQILFQTKKSLFINQSLLKRKLMKAI